MEIKQISPKALRLLDDSGTTQENLCRLSLGLDDETCSGSNESAVDFALHERVKQSSSTSENAPHPSPPRSRPRKLTGRLEAMNPNSLLNVLQAWAKTQVQQNFARSTVDFIQQAHSQRRNDLTVYPSTERLPEIFDRFNNLHSLHVLPGTVSFFPRTLESCHEIQNLCVASNRLPHIPGYVASFSKLLSLDLSGNCLKELPKELGSMRNLLKLNVSNNGISLLPESLGDLGSLRDLSVHNNKLIDLPKSIARLDKLERLSMHKNEVKAVPNVIEHLPALRYLRIDSDISDKFSYATQAILWLRLVEMHSV